MAKIAFILIILTRINIIGLILLNILVSLLTAAHGGNTKIIYKPLNFINHAEENDLTNIGLDVVIPVVVFRGSCQPWDHPRPGF